MLKPNQKKIAPVSGWIEVLQRRKPLTDLARLEDLDFLDYDMALRYDCREFNGPYEVYEFLVKCPEVLLRPLARFDVLNLIFNEPSKASQIISVVLIDIRKDRDLVYPKAQVQYRPPMELHALPIIQPSQFPSYAANSRL